MRLPGAACAVLYVVPGKSARASAHAFLKSAQAFFGKHSQKRTRFSRKACTEVRTPFEKARALFRNENVHFFPTICGNI